MSAPQTGRDREAPGRANPWHGWRAARRTLAGLGLLAAALAARGEALLPAGLYGLQIRPVPTAAEQTELRQQLPTAPRGKIDGGDFAIHQCLTPADVATLGDLARTLQHRQPGRCEQVLLDERRWRTSCDLQGTPMLHEGVALIESDRFAAHLTVTVGAGQPAYLLATGLLLGPDCATAAAAAADDSWE